MPEVLSSKPRTPHRSQQDVSPITSPGYFGLSIDTQAAAVGSGGARGVKGNFPISNSTARPTATSPKQNPPPYTSHELDAFRREVGRSGFHLNQGSVPQYGFGSNGRRPAVPVRSNTHEIVSPSTKSPTIAFQSREAKATEDLPPVSRSPKRLLSQDSYDMRRGREASGPSTNDTRDRADGSPPAKQDDKCPRLSLPHEAPTLHPEGRQHRAETLPVAFSEDEGPSLVSPQHVVNILDSRAEESLLLDLRVSTQYEKSHIVGALNLCVPTTLLKRPAYNVSKLADTFKDSDQRSKFERWRKCKCIVMYEANCQQMKEATNCTNLLKKFNSEGWQGNAYVIKGGFFDFSRKFPAYVKQGSASSGSPTVPSISLKKDDNRSVAPVIGGCPMPATENAANPFFGNIRQNMDLIGGVGQFSVSLPPAVTRQQWDDLPAWLRRAADEGDEGKFVSEKYLKIEKNEQSRMREALSGNVVYGTPSPSTPSKIQIAGIEKGAKNRYNNIWPFEHSRVKLQGVANSGCDYVNANFVQTSLSNKRYIATQGPIPATFADFWNMVWQRDVRVIVMLTAEKEGGQVKADNYWSGRDYGQLKLKFVSEQKASLEPEKVRRNSQKRPSLGKSRASFPPAKPAPPSDKKSARAQGSAAKTPGPGSHGLSQQKPPSVSSDEAFVHVRKFVLTHRGHSSEAPREITQLQYSSWPDFGAPAHPAHLLGLVEQCNAHVASSAHRDARPASAADPAPPDERPVLVHCSAGCGRTGTFCTVDSVVDMLKRQAAHVQTRKSQPLREPTPMDIDPPSGADAQRMDVDDEGQLVRATRDGVAGGWLDHDDMDLVERAVAEFRLQRLSMVQSLRQFVLCYEAVLEWAVSTAERR